MVRVGTVYQYEIPDRLIIGTVCPHCQAQINVDLMKSVQKVTMLFIPVIKKTVSYYSVCPYCKKQYLFNKKEYEQILQSPIPQSVWNATSHQILNREIKKADKEILRSPKKVSIASALALLFGLFGLQNLYMGHTKRFVINLALLFFSIVIFAAVLISQNVAPAFLVAVFVTTNIYWGIVDFIRILSGHAKDKNKYYILTNAQYRKRLQKHAYLHNTTVQFAANNQHYLP